MTTEIAATLEIIDDAIRTLDRVEARARRWKWTAIAFALLSLAMALAPLFS